MLLIVHYVDILFRGVIGFSHENKGRGTSRENTLFTYGVQESGGVIGFLKVFRSSIKGGS